MTNQARFIRMIIDGQLVVSKKKKADLVAELRKKDFKPISRVRDAVAAGETELVVENDEDDADAVVGANVYDYLLGVGFNTSPSLTHSPDLRKLIWLLSFRCPSGR